MYAFLKSVKTISYRNGHNIYTDKEDIGYELDNLRNFHTY